MKKQMETADSLSWPSVLKSEFREHLPVWFIYFETIFMLHLLLASYPDALFNESGYSRGMFVPTMVFPMLIFLVYMGLRIKHSARLHRKKRAGLILGLLSLVPPAAVIWGYQPFHLDMQTLKSVYEITAFLYLILFLIQILWKRGAWNLLIFFGITFIYGLVLENTGIIMGYFSEPGYLIYLGFLPAPLCTMIGWPILFYIMFSLTERFASWWPWLKSRAWARAITATGLALCFDIQLDPLASLSGLLWQWNKALPPSFLGVPILNFVAWSGAFLPYSWMVFRILDRADISPGRQSWELLLRVPLAAVLGGLLCFGVMAVLEAGFDGPTYQILDSFLERMIPY